MPRGWENIVLNQGVSVAIAGMLVVFSVLVLISLFITFLPRALDLLHLVAPEEDRLPQPEKARSTAQNEELAAAIGYAMHLQTQK